ASQHPRRDQELREQTDYPADEVEVAEKDRALGLPGDEFLNESAELPPGDRGDERGKANHRGDSLQVRGRADRAQALPEIARNSLVLSLLNFEGADAGLPLAPYVH